MPTNSVRTFIVNVLKNMPSDWLKLTTHRLDIYDEKLAKTQFLDTFEELCNTNNFATSALEQLPTAFDYIRLGHPLSCILEWGIAKQYDLHPNNIISFSSNTIPVMAILRRNHFQKINTTIFHSGELPNAFDFEALRRVYGYRFDVQKVDDVDAILEFNGSTIFLSQDHSMGEFALNSNVDYFVNVHSPLGSVLLINGHGKEGAVSDIQHVRRRETIAMTPANCLVALHMFVGKPFSVQQTENATHQKQVLDSIRAITGTHSKALVASSGLSMQYAILMGLIDDALEQHPGKAIKIIVPPNCYGGTNDQARRVADCLDAVEVVDLPVDGDNDMVQSIDMILEATAHEDAIPLIIAEIPTNPRVEVPDLLALKAVLRKERTTTSGAPSIAPVFILDQTFCPNVLFLGEGQVLSAIKAISYVSGSKFPSGGLCTAGYCAANEKAEPLMEKIEKHLLLCDNQATNLQMELLAQQLPSMKQRIRDAYTNTREFVNFIQDTLPMAKINFVSEELAAQGFTPSVFSLDLPTKGNSHEERETYKRALNNKLINAMIAEIPDESKYCVSYGQLKGCYWTIPATSTQGTTKEGDKDYIARVSVSPNMDLKRHKKVFLDFVERIS